MSISKVRVGTGNKQTTVRFWMDGTPQEIKEKLSNRFRIYEERQTKKTKEQPKAKKVVTPETVAA